MPTLHDTTRYLGDVSIVLKGSNGNIKAKWDRHNLVVDTGRNLAANRLANNTAGPLTHMALGTGTTAANNANNALQAENARVAFTGNDVTGNQAVFTATFGPGVGIGPLTEAGLFNAAAAGAMFSRIVFPVVNKEAGDSMTFVWAIKAL